MKRLLTAALCVALAIHSQSARAAFGITSVSGAIELPGPPPPNTLPGSNEASLPLIIPEVLGGIVVGTGANPTGLPVDHYGSDVVASPIISGNIVNQVLINLTIPVGTFFNSYLFHFDPIGTPDFADYLSTLKFDGPVLGVQLFSDGFVLQKPSGTGYVGTLELGDFQIALNGGPPPAYYPGSVNYRGMEEDFFKLEIAGNTVTLIGSVSGVEIDQIRILTGVPEPNTAALAGMGLIGFAAFLAKGRRRG